MLVGFFPSFLPLSLSFLETLSSFLFSIVPFPKNTEKGFKSTHSPETFMAETVRDGTIKDPAKTSCCIVCGSPNNLKLCSACKLVRYCGRECQMADWKNHKELCKKKQAELATEKK